MGKGTCGLAEEVLHAPSPQRLSPQKGGLVTVYRQSRLGDSFSVLGHFSSLGRHEL